MLCKQGLTLGQNNNSEDFLTRQAKFSQLLVAILALANCNGVALSQKYKR